MLYNLYLKDPLLRIEAQCALMGIQVAWGYPLLLVDFADDIHAFVQLDRIADFMHIVTTELGVVNQQLHVDKCKIMVVSRQRCLHTHVEGMPVVHSMRILGVDFPHHARMKTNVVSKTRTGMAQAVLHNARLHRFGCNRDVQIMNVMLHSDVKQSMLFGVGTWGYHGLSVNPMEHVLQKPYSIMQRAALGQPHSTAHWVASMVSGNLPVQHFILLSFCRMWNRLLVAAQRNTLLQACLQEQHALCRRRSHCWLKKWYDAFQRLLPGAQLHTCLLNAAAAAADSRLLAAAPPIDIAGLEDTLFGVYTARMAGWGDPMHDACTHRRMALSAMLLQQGEWGRRPQQLKWVIECRARQTWIDFLCANVKLPVHDYMLCRAGNFDTRMCRKCRVQEPGDEAHVLLRCPATHCVRTTFAPRLIWVTNLKFLVELNIKPVFAQFAVAAVEQYLHSPDIT